MDNVDIIVNDYDENNYFVVIKKGRKNLYMDLGICQFVDEMKHWSMPTIGSVYDGEAGYIFSKKLNADDIRMEIERIVIRNISD
ncbi:MAG: hypothetical protein IKK33_08350 [Lachnospiraceae bacterium]|nr:hypothetical protein [Lachnospiraceae bacterium]